MIVAIRASLWRRRGPIIRANADPRLEPPPEGGWGSPTFTRRDALG